MVNKMISSLFWALGEVDMAKYCVVQPDSVLLCQRWEAEVATPALISAGFIVHRWKTQDVNPGWPFCRFVVVEKDSEVKTLYYQ